MGDHLNKREHDCEAQGEGEHHNTRQGASNRLTHKEGSQPLHNQLSTFVPPPTSTS